ncbi:MAG: hypothetical protein ACYTHM_04180 [Planctomycetota bacterium]|jgi:hypothetical protein
MRTALLCCLFTVLIPGAVGTGVLHAGETATPLYDLAFTPKKGDRIVVDYQNQEVWKYKSRELMGNVKTTFTLQWKVTKGMGEGKAEAKGEFLSAAYRGGGTSKGKPFTYNVVWSKEKGYSEGEKDEANQRWVQKEIAQGVTLTFDRRGAADVADC